MNNESALLVAVALGTRLEAPRARASGASTELAAVDTPVHFSVSHTRAAQTPLPVDLLPATLWIPPSGRLLVDEDPRHALVRSSANFALAAAKALSHSAEDERAVAVRVAEVLGDQKPRPLTRKLGA